MFEMGFTRGKLAVYVFHDDREDLRWFNRDAEKVGEIETWLDGPVPANPKEVLRVAREACGPTACVIW